MYTFQGPRIAKEPGSHQGLASENEEPLYLESANEASKNRVLANLLPKTLEHQRTCRS